MSYTKQTWLARLGAGLNKFINSGDSHNLELTPNPDSISQEGTPFTADRMNHIEDGIYAAHEYLGNIMPGSYTNKALYLNYNGKPTASSVTATELGYLSGVTGAIQTQLDAKESAMSIPSGYSSYSGSHTLSNNTYYKISQNGSLTLYAPSSGWAHGMIYTGSYSSITFSPYTFLIAPPTLQSGKYYEFDVLDGVWAISERT